MNEGEDFDPSTIVDPAVRHILQRMQEEIRAASGMMRDYRALLIEHKALQLEHTSLLLQQRTTLAENVALLAELARLKGGHGQPPRAMPGKPHSGDRLPRGKRRREAEREAAEREAAEREAARPTSETLPADAT